MDVPNNPCSFPAKAGLQRENLTRKAQTETGEKKKKKNAVGHKANDTYKNLQPTESRTLSSSRQSVNVFTCVHKGVCILMSLTEDKLSYTNPIFLSECLPVCLTTTKKGMRHNAHGCVNR